MSDEGLPVQLIMTELWCQKQIGPGDDQIYVTVVGSKSDKSRISDRLPGPNDAHWSMNQEHDSPCRRIENIRLWVGNLDDGQFVDVMVTVKEGTRNDAADETAGAIRVVVAKKEGEVTIRGTPRFNNTTGGECAPEPNHGGDQVFDLRHGDGHYVMWIRAPRSC